MDEGDIFHEDSPPNVILSDEDLMPNNDSPGGTRSDSPIIKTNEKGTVYILGPRINKEGLTERVIILCKLNKSLLKSSKSVGIHRQKSLYSLKNLCI